MFVGGWLCFFLCFFFVYYNLPPPTTPHPTPTPPPPHPPSQATPKFLNMVTSWQRRLGMVEAVLGVWTAVQGKWSNLVTVFVGSADIRQQLPEHAARFEAVHHAFEVWVWVLWVCHVSCHPFNPPTPSLLVVQNTQVFMHTAPSIVNVAEACNVEGRQDTLEHMLLQLETCEKALQVGDCMHVCAFMRCMVLLCVMCDARDILCVVCDARDILCVV